jgi:hypothetical protein
MITKIDDKQTTFWGYSIIYTTKTTRSRWMAVQIYLSFQKRELESQLD